MTERASDHLANERTFLAWIRTSIGIMAFGFVVEKFVLFMKQIAAFLEKETLSHPIQGYSDWFGIALVALGALMSIFAFIRYKMIQKQLQTNDYYPSTFLDLVLTLSVVLIGVFLLIYLLSGIY